MTCRDTKTNTKLKVSKKNIEEKRQRFEKEREKTEDRKNKLWAYLL